MAAYDAVCFDLDSTLCEPCREPDERLEATFSHAGVDPFCTPADLRIASTCVPTAETDREFFECLFEAAARQADIDPAVAPDLARSHLEFADPSDVRFRPGAKRALRRARENGPVGLITNGGCETQTQKLEALDLLDAVDVSVFTDPRNGVPPKPDPTPFERALSGLDTTADAAIHVGDSLHADIGGANAMGMDSAWIDPGIETPGDHEPTYELASLEELDALL
ncbi:HAD family hydrolase [Natronosalvus vescus]|uniref:HAD family hydrolase n=1 Tax=Natronosalvus vescus TaxID=2953881 RepID=UPI0020901967|nr:HAD family hydrolase [Natronosalvus vescus]